KAAVVYVDTLARDTGGQITDDAAFAPGFFEADPTVTIGVRNGQGLQAHLQADHFDQPAAEQVRGIAAAAAVLGDGHAGAAVAVGDIMTGTARTGVAAVHHLADAVGQGDAVELAGIAVHAVALAEVTLGHA